MSRKPRYVGPHRKALQAMLRERGFYSTEGRLELLALLKAARKPLSVPAIERRLGQQLDRVNVYRALEALTRSGLLARSDVRQGGAHYELPGAHHHHIVCNDCGTTEDVDLCVGQNVESSIQKNSQKFASVTAHALEFFGTCASCSR